VIGNGIGQQIALIKSREINFSLMPLICSVGVSRCCLVSGTPLSVAAAETKPTEHHVTKTVKLTEPISEHLTSTDTQRSAANDDRAAALSGSDLRSNQCYSLA